MSDRLNTIFGWILFSGIVALGLSSLSGHFFSADKPHSPEEPGYFVEAAEGGEVEAGPSLATLLAEGSAADGEGVFAKCLACHTIDQGGANGIGPNIYGVLGEPVGQGAGGFAFSSSLAEVGGTWTYEQMDAWLKSPRAFASGTKMSFAGLSKDEDRANVILYLREHGGGPDLPVPEVAAPEGDAAAEGEAAEGEAPAVDAGTEEPAAESETA